MKYFSPGLWKNMESFTKSETPGKMSRLASQPYWLYKDKGGGGGDESHSQKRDIILKNSSHNTLR